MTGTNLQGTNIISMIVPTNHADTYATHDSFYGKGGWREVDTLVERDAIPQERRRQGMVVFVKETFKAYILKNSIYNGGWTPFPATEDVSEIVNEAIASGQIIIDLTNYATKAEISEEFAKYYTSEQVNEIVTDTIIDVKEWVEEQGYLTQHQSLANYVTKDEMAGALDSYVLESILEQTLEDYAKSEDIITTLEDYAKISDIEAVYATKEDVTSDIQTITDSVNDIGKRLATVETDYITDTELEEKGYINSENAKEIIDSYGYIDSTSLTDALSPYATIASVDSKLQSYPTITEVESILSDGGYVTVQDLQGYATELWVQNYITDGDYVTVRDLQGYATELWVQDLVNSIIGGDIDLTAYQKKTDLDLETEAKTIVGAINELNDRPSVDIDEVIETIEQRNAFVSNEDYETKCAEYEQEIASLQEENAALQETVSTMQTKLDYVYDIITTPHYDVLPDEEP